MSCIAMGGLLDQVLTAVLPFQRFIFAVAAVGATLASFCLLPDKIRAEANAPLPPRDAPIQATIDSLPDTAALMNMLSAWIVHNFDLPIPSSSATIKFIPAQQMARLRIEINRQRSRPMPGSYDEDIVAFYDWNTRSIYLPEGWSAADPVQISILVHELVHHIEACAQAHRGLPTSGERLAYEAQERWLNIFGNSLNGALGIDEFSVLMRTEWLY